MKRRTFVKRSVAATLLTPLAFSGLINAAGAVEGGGTGTTWFSTEGTTTVGADDMCVHQGVTPNKWQNGQGAWVCAVRASCGSNWNNPKGYRSPAKACVVNGVDQCVNANPDLPESYHIITGQEAVAFGNRVECDKNP